jgi:hypothetical protein
MSTTTFVATPLSAYPDLTPRQRTELDINPDPAQDRGDPRELVNMAAVLTSGIATLGMSAAMSGKDPALVGDLRALSRVAARLRSQLAEQARAL